MNWNLGGFNPNYQEFVAKHPNKTLIGMWWSMNWRMIIIMFVLEIIIVFAFVFMAIAFSAGNAAHTPALNTNIPVGAATQ